MGMQFCHKLVPYLQKAFGWTLRFTSGMLGTAAYAYGFWVLFVQFVGFMLNLSQKGEWSFTYPSFLENQLSSAQFAGLFPFSVDYNSTPVPKMITDVFAGKVDTNSIAFKIFFNSVLFALYTVPHSVLARPHFKNKLPHHLGQNPLYRSAYVALAAAGLYYMMMFWQPLSTSPQYLFEIKNEYGVMSLNACLFISYVWFVASTFAVDHFEYFGLSQAWGVDLNARLLKLHRSGLVTSGLQKYCRQPFFWGFYCLLFLAPKMSQSHLLFSSLWLGYIYVAVIKFMEPELVSEHGKDYRDYMAKTVRFCPFGYLMNKSSHPAAVAKDAGGKKSRASSSASSKVGSKKSSKSTPTAGKKGGRSSSVVGKKKTK